MTNLTPREIVSELDRFIIGQDAAKRAVAIALRNRWRRQNVQGKMQKEIHPKNILMIGPTGVGKTEISRRLATLANAPFIKVEATKFTEVGYVGRDVDQIIRDLIENALHIVREKERENVKSRAHKAAQDRIVSALAGENAREQTKDAIRQKLKNGEFDEEFVELELNDNTNPFQMIDIPGQPGLGMGMLNLGDIFGGLGGKKQKRKIKIGDSYELLLNEEADKLIDDNVIQREAINAVENNGIVFIDEIDKVAASQNRSGDVSREGVQRDLLPLIEGTTVTTKYGPIQTDHILFIASGAFHISKPSDLLPELQGRLPIRVNLNDLNASDFKRILLEPENALTKQYIALMQTEEIDLSFSEDAIDRISELASEVNATVENIGARRLQTLLEKILEDLSFRASDEPASSVEISKQDVNDALQDIAQSADLNRFML